MVRGQRIDADDEGRRETTRGEGTVRVIRGPPPNGGRRDVTLLSRAGGSPSPEWSQGSFALVALQHAAYLFNLVSQTLTTSLETDDEVPALADPSFRTGSTLRPRRCSRLSRRSTTSRPMVDAKSTRGAPHQKDECSLALGGTSHDEGGQGGNQPLEPPRAFQTPLRFCTPQKIRD